MRTVRQNNTCFFVLQKYLMSMLNAAAEKTILIRRETKNISLITKYPAATTSVNSGHVEAVALCPML